MVQIKGVKKTYDRGLPKESKALKGIDLEFGDVGFVGIVGKSGCGKTTLLNCLAGLDGVDCGQVMVGGKDIVKFSKKELDEYRNQEIAVVFQEFYCMDDLTVAQNINLARFIQGKQADNDLLDRVLESVGIAEYAHRKLTELSGGQKQRVAIARALVKDAKVILCDEPTGNLDEQTAKQIFGLLQSIAKDRLVIVVSHDKENTQEYCDRVVTIAEGLVESDIAKSIETVQAGVDAQSASKSTIQEDKAESNATNNAQKHRGKMSVGLRLKTGMGWMTAKKVRLVMSVLLPSVMLGVFLMTFAFWSFSPLKKELQLTYDLGARAVEVQRRFYQEPNSPAYDDRFGDYEKEDFAKTHIIQTTYQDDRFASVSVNFGVYRGGLADDWANTNGSRMMEIESDQMAQEFGLTVVEGRLPQASMEYDEVAITDFMYYAKFEGAKWKNAQEKEITIDSPQVLFENEIIQYYKNKEESPDLLPIKVVGVVNTGYNLEDFYNHNLYQLDGTRQYNKYGGREMSLQNTIANVMILGKGNGWIDQIAPELDALDLYSTTREMVALKGDYRQDKVLFGDKEFLGFRHNYTPYTPLSDGFRSVYDVVDFAGKAGLWVSLGAAVFSLLLIMNFMLAIVDNNRKKVGIMCALGIRRKDLDGIFLFGCGFVGLIVVGAAVGFGAIFLSLWNQLLTLDVFVITGLSLLVTAGIALGGMALMTLAPLKKLIRKRTIDIIKKAV
ncbi:MAG: ABC transporter ATP-binding protein/permease [Firmicutes bacterium]|nr:ABC transporter ATP-binding protein/permease [Bacillota bacterium]